MSCTFALHSSDFFDVVFMLQQLEEVQAEKVSMEFLLREKLERLVQSEIERRVAAYRREEEGDSQSTHLRVC